MHLIGGIAIPFLGTALGAAMVFLMKNNLCRRVEKILLGVASGVMIAASVWSLLIPAIDMAEEKGGVPWITVSVGFSLGIFFLLLIDYLLERLSGRGTWRQEKNLHDGVCGNASQSAGGDGGGCLFCRRAVK